MFVLTKEPGDMESGAYATHDQDGTTIVQFFVDKDDAISYNELLAAVGYELAITETPDDNLDKLCDLMGYAYTIAEPGDIVYPRIETFISEVDL